MGINETYSNKKHIHTKQSEPTFKHPLHYKSNHTFRVESSRWTHRILEKTMVKWYWGWVPREQSRHMLCDRSFCSITRNRKFIEKCVQKVDKTTMIEADPGYLGEIMECMMTASLLYSLVNSRKISCIISRGKLEATATGYFWLRSHKVTRGGSGWLYRWPRCRQVTLSTTNFP